MDQMFLCLSNSRIVKDQEWDNVRLFLTNINTQLPELKNSFSLDFLEKGSPGSKFVSRSVQINWVGNNHLELEELFSIYSDAIRTLEITKPKIARPDKNVYKQSP